MDLIRYIIIASLCLSIFYAGYRFIFRQSTSFLQARIYLMISVVLSMIIPFSGFSIETGLTWPGRSESVLIADVITSPSSGPQEIVKTTFRGLLSDIEWTTAGLYIYLFVTGFLLLRILFMLITLFSQYRNSFKVHLEDCVLLYNHRFSNTFSFFRWIFVHPSDSEDDLNKIITHERVHINQYHSLDILLIELLTAVMWFNPLVWIMKGSLQLVHEYLADDGALDTGIDKSEYQALLINQVAEERIIGLSSSFNQSLIKKRIIMMTKTKIKSRSVLKLLALLPVTFMVFTLMAVFNGISAKQANAMDSGIFITKNMGSLAALTVAPPDTIIKKTIIKKISKDNPNDTIVEEKEEILTGADAEREHMTIRHRGGERGEEVIIHDRSGDRREVRVYVEDGNDLISHERRDDRVMRYSFHVDADEEVREEEFGDSVRTVKIIRHGGGTPMAERHVSIRHADSKEPVSKVLYIVDGEPYYRPIETIDVKTVESMNVIKGKDMSKYTKENYDAVIVIKTNKGK